MMVGDMAITWWKHYASHKLFQPLRHPNFLGYVVTKFIIEKQPNFESSPNKKYLCWDNETWSEPVPDTYKYTEKISGCSHFQGHCNYNFSNDTFL